MAVVLSAAMVASLYACSGQTEKKVDVTTTGNETTGEATEIKFSWWGGDSRHEATEKAVTAFMGA